MKFLFQKKQPGYIALMSVIIICLILLAMVSVLAMTNFFSRSNVSDREYKRVSMGLAESCANVALLKLATDFYYHPAGEIVSVGANNCTIDEVTGTSTLKVIKTSANFNNAFSDMEIRATVQDPVVSPINGATLTVVTHVINDNGGTLTASDFAMKVTAVDPVPDSFQGVESGEVVFVKAGGYSVTGIGNISYTFSTSPDCSGSVSVGKNKTCVFTYDDIPVNAKVTLIANIMNDNGGTITNPSDFPLFFSGVARTSGQPFTVSPGTYSASNTAVAGYTASLWGYHCAGNGDITLAAGDNKTCIVTYDDNEPPTPVCAETVMMLDRTGSMSSASLSDERTAAISLINLYSSIPTPPKVGVGSFGGFYGSTAAQVPDNTHPVVGWLTTAYSTITNAITQLTGSNSSVGTDLFAAISAGNNELNSSRHVAGKEKVLILVSDGEPNEPSGNMAFDTGFKSPATDTQNAAGEAWSNTANAYADGGGDASDPVSENDRHRFYNFNFPAISSGSTITGIQAQADAWATTNPVSSSTPPLVPIATGKYGQWNPNTGTDVSAVSTSNGDTSYIDVSLMVHTFSFPNSAVPSGATINSVTINAVARGTASGATMQLVAENGTAPSAGSNINLTTSYATYSRQMTTNPFTGSAWTLSEVNNWTTRFGVLNTSAGVSVPRVTYIYVVVAYTTTVSNNIQKAPGATHSPNQWSTADRAFISDNVYATENTNGEQQGYSNFNFGIPANATIQGIVVTTEAKVSGSSPANTATLYPDSDGNYTSWNGDHSDVDETGTPVCSNGDYITSSGSNSRSSFGINLSSIPDGSTINSVSITVGDRGDSSSGGTYRTFIRLNGANTDAGGSALTASGNSGSTCYSHTQTITVGSVVKSSGTDLEIGVVKVSGNSNAVRVGVINAVINYTQPGTGSLGITLSSNNGGSWTASKSVSLTGTETVSTPAGNSSSDMWGRSWVQSDFNDGNFVLRVQNNSTNGYVVSLDQIQATVYYTVSTLFSNNLIPSATGNYDQWAPNTGTDVNSVSANDGDTSYIDVSSMVHTFSFPNSALPSGATINSVTLNALARGTSGTSTVQLVAENGGTPNAGSNINLTTSYATYSRQMTTNPFTGSAWTLSEVNNWTTKFGVRTTSGSTARVTQLYIIVNYTITGGGGTSCQLGMDLSWNGGTSWTTEKIITLTGSEASYLLGSASDDWTSSHNWAPSEFSNANFRARVRAIDPGSACQDAAIDHLDWLQMKVYYNQPADPTSAAYSAADAAKLSGTNIFTIHFGSTGGRDLLAKLASGNTPNAPHQNGSYFDSSGIVNGDTGYISPTSQIIDTGGDNNGFEINPNNAFSDGSGYASNMDGYGDRHRFYNYNISIPPGASVTGIVVRPDWWTESTSGNNSVNIELSWNGGANWTSAKTQSSESTSDQNNKTVGGSTDNWGRSWAAADFINNNFRVRITSNCNNSSSCNNRDFYLDWIPVRIYYTVIAENGDDDNFFISPNSSDMQSIFETIGEKVCPALSNPAPTAPPTTASLMVINYMINDNGATSSASDFTMKMTTASSSPSTFAGEGSPGTLVTLDPGIYNVDENIVVGYNKTIGVGCSGTINAGETRTCTITNDDKPPAPALPVPPEPVSNVTIDSWVEHP